MTSVRGMRVGVVGVGLVGEGIARRLSATEGVSSVVLLGGAQRRHEKVASALGPIVRSAPEGQEVVDLDLDVVVACCPDETQLEVASAALTGGMHVVTLGDSVQTTAGLLGLDDFATEVGRTVVVGAGASPGLSSVLAMHAASLFDEVDEISVAIAGAGGPACNDRRTRAARSDSQEWREREWVDVAARSGAELVWFPEPIGAVDCARGDLSEPLVLRRRFEEVGLISAKLGRGVIPAQTRLVATLRRRAVEEPGGIRVAVSGRIDAVPTTVVYGCKTGLATASAVVASTAARHIVGSGSSGARPLAEMVSPGVILAAMDDAALGCLVYDGND